MDGSRAARSSHRSLLGRRYYRSRRDGASRATLTGRWAERFVQESTKVGHRLWKSSSYVPHDRRALGVLTPLTGLAKETAAQRRCRFSRNKRLTNAAPAPNIELPIAIA